MEVFTRTCRTCQASFRYQPTGIKGWGVKINVSMKHPSCIFSPVSGCHLQIRLLRSADRIKPGKPTTMNIKRTAKNEHWARIWSYVPSSWLWDVLHSKNIRKNPEDLTAGIWKWWDWEDDFFLFPGGDPYSQVPAVNLQGCIRIFWFKVKPPSFERMTQVTAPAHCSFRCCSNVSGFHKTTWRWKLFIRISWGNGWMGIDVPLVDCWSILVFDTWIAVTSAATFRFVNMYVSTIQYYRERERERCWLTSFIRVTNHNCTIVAITINILYIHRVETTWTLVQFRYTIIATQKPCIKRLFRTIRFCTKVGQKDQIIVIAVVIIIIIITWMIVCKNLATVPKNDMGGYLKHSPWYNKYRIWVIQQISNLGGCFGCVIISGQPPQNPSRSDLTCSASVSTSGCFLIKTAVSSDCHPQRGGEGKSCHLGILPAALFTIWNRLISRPAVIDKISKENQSPAVDEVYVSSR